MPRACGKLIPLNLFLYSPVLNLELIFSSLSLVIKVLHS